MIPDYIKHWFLSRTGRVLWVELNNPKAWKLVHSCCTQLIHIKSDFEFRSINDLFFYSWINWEPHNIRLGYIERWILQSRIRRLVDMIQADKVVNL